LFFLIAQISNAAQTHEIAIDENGFSNIPRKVFIGDTIRWTNRGIENHQIQTKSGIYLDSGLLSPGVSYEYTFERKIPQVRIHPTTTIYFFDKETPTNELSFELLNEPVTLSPKIGLFKRTNSFNFLIFLGENFTPSLPVIPKSPIKEIELTLNGVQIFSGSLDEFKVLNFVNSESLYNNSFSISTNIEGFRVFSIVVNPNILSIGVHSINVKVTRFDSLIYEDSARYTIF